MTSQSHLCNLNQSSNQDRETQKLMLRLRFDGVRAQYLPVAVRRLSTRSNSTEGKPGKVGRRKHDLWLQIIISTFVLIIPSHSLSLRIGLRVPND